MNVTHIEIADKMLKFFAANDGKANTDMWDNCDELKSYEYILRGDVRTMLEDRKYLQPFDESRYWDRLTKPGWKAAEIGIEAYELQEEERERNKHLNIENSIVNTGINTGQQNISQSSSGASFLRTNQTVNNPPKKETTIIRDILIGLFVTIVGGLVLYYYTR